MATHITITPNGNDLTISSTGGGSGTSKINRITVGPGLTGGGDSGNVLVQIGTESILNTMLGYHSVTESKIEDRSWRQAWTSPTEPNRAMIPCRNRTTGRAIE